VRKLLDRAKGKLQTEQGMSEPDAFRWIQKTSMDQRLAMRTVAERILEGAMTPGAAAGNADASSAPGGTDTAGGAKPGSGA
jgi:two-component system, response regulator PdtaR